ncbi:heme ABC exporter ATP-binding protein CcmA [Psychrobacter sp. TAE2020]|uniref:heme ABC exporter ATP-binding protein CcmA n=1 Tax=Psychrobacter sp. TAE2020 TaxID=2846762 RepID=UPI001E656FEF|nr:heme ABC exporter ATP-binding protein CcmA [Psychrobacter sp. TAE2020]
MSLSAMVTSAPSILQFEQLTVQRGEIPLCEQVKLCLTTGNICHLIGANGTGKTTLLMQLAGLLPVLIGEVSYLGLAGLPVQPLYVSHQLGINSSLTVAQNLTFLLNLYGISPSHADIDEALDWVGLQGFETISSSHLSAGQTRRITLARLYLLTPAITPLWLLDEPFTALDVDMVIRMETRLREFADAGGAIVMTSHQPVGVANQVLDLSEYMA